MSFKDDLAAAKATKRRTAIVSVVINEKAYKFRFTRMDGMEYAKATLLCPPDLEVPLHKHYGYDIHALALRVAPVCAVLLDGDEEVELSPEDWADLFEVADGGAIEEIGNTVFELNEFATSRAVELAKKVLDGSALSSPLPSV